MSVVGIELSAGVRVTSQRPVDARYLKDLVPYTDIDQVNTTIPISERHIGLRVNISGVNYSYKNGIEDSDLVVDIEENIALTDQENTFTAHQRFLDKISINTENAHPFNASIYFPMTDRAKGSIINTFIDLIRDGSDSADNLFYGILRRVVYTGAEDLKELIGSYDIARYMGSGSITSLISKLNVTSYKGQGTVSNAIFGQQNRAQVESLTGNANINIVLGQENKVRINDHKATIEWVQGSSSSIEIVTASDVKNAFVHRFDIDQINEPLNNLYILYQSETAIPPIKTGGSIYFIYSLMDIPSLLSGELTAKSFISSSIEQNTDLAARYIVYNQTSKRFETAKNTPWQTLSILDGTGNVNATGNLRYRIVNNRLILNGTVRPTRETGNLTPIGFLPSDFIPDTSRRIAIASISNNSILEVTTGTGLISIANPELNTDHLIDFECTLKINY